MKSAPLQSNFQGGEFSPLAQGRIELDRYRSGLATCLNYIPTLQGGLTRRPGTYFVRETDPAASTTGIRLVRFEFSTEQAYILEFIENGIRFYKDRAVIVSGGSPVSLSTDYAEEDLFELSFTQSADTLFICHPNYIPRTLTRTSHTSWTLTDLHFNDGPYEPFEDLGYTLTPSATTGTVTITASSAIFAATDVGRNVRLLISNVYGWAVISGFTDTTHVTAVVHSDFGAASATSQWWLGLWSDTTGYPACVTFHQDRLFFGGGASYLQRVDGSASGDYLNFAPSDTDGVITDAHAVSYSLNSNKVNAIRWMTSSDQGLFIGTSGSEWLLSASSLGEALTATNVKADEISANGSSTVSPTQSGSATLYMQRGNRKLRELVYYEGRGKVISPDLTVIAEHITQSGIVQIASQPSPQSLIWAVRVDGVLACMTYERDIDSLRVGWHRHVVGGVSDADGNPAKVVSVAVIPSPDTTVDDVWLVVQRYVDGNTVYHIEYITPIYNDEMGQDDAFFLDAGLTYSGVAVDTLTGLDHLEGEEVMVLAEGAVEGPYTVTSGEITVSRDITKAHVGLAYNSDCQLLRIEAGSADGTSLGKYRRTHRLGLLVHRTAGLNIGIDFDNLDELDFRTDVDVMGSPPALFSGIISEVIDSVPDLNDQICIRQTQPVPGTILAIMPRMDTEND